MLLSESEIQDRRYGDHIEKAAMLVFDRNLSPWWAKYPLSTSKLSVKSFKSYWALTKFKMAATLKKLWCWFLGGTFPLMGPIHPVNFKPTGRGIQKLLSGNKIQDGCHGGHIEKAVMLVFQRNLSFDGPNTPYKFQSNRSKHSKVKNCMTGAVWL
jgi:hypothetical protein